MDSDKKYSYNPDNLKFEEVPESFKDRFNRIVNFIGTAAMLLCGALLLIISAKGPKRVIVEQEQEVSTIIVPDSSNVIPTSSHDDLIEALIYVESRGTDTAVNYKSNAVGCLQIRPIMVEEVNRILEIIGSGQRYYLRDRFNRKKSIEMFTIWRLFHHIGHSYEVIARNWNGGPGGYLNKSTIDYWHNVKKVLK